MQYYIIILCVHVRLSAKFNSYTQHQNIVTQCKDKMYMLLKNSQLCNRGTTKYLILWNRERYVSLLIMLWLSALRIQVNYIVQNFVLEKYITASGLLIYKWFSVVHKITWYNKYRQPLKFRPGRCSILL